MATDVTPKRLRTGIYGGSFNPIHNGHIALARTFLNSLGLDEVWFVVSPQNPFKRNDALLDDAKRLQLVETALQGETAMKPCDVEFHLPKPSYMWHTLQTLSQNHLDRDFTLLIGGDNWTRFSRWYKAEEILRNYPIAVYPREDDPIDEASLPHGVTLVSAQLLPISSTDIRQKIARGEDITALVPPNTAAMATSFYSEP